MFETNEKDLKKVLLHRRGIMGEQDEHVFLNPDYEQHIADPGLLPDIDKATKRIMHALQNNETICVYADFDADGIPGAVVFHDFFKKIGYDDALVYIPHRLDEGYGFHEHALEGLQEQGVTLIITVDVGIRDTETVIKANELGIDVIITDHHEVGDKIPDAHAVVNPKLGNTYPDPMICGCAVAWQVVRALINTIKEESIEPYAEKLPDGWEKWLLDMVGIATLSDMVPLVKENRVFATYGLKVLKKTRRPGLQALFVKNKINLNHLTEDDIGFSITPKLNAASRMSHPKRAFDLLVANTPNEAQPHVEHLMWCNDERKKQVATTMRAVNKRLSERELKQVIVIGDPSWGQGILGLVASKIVDQYGKPAFVWSKNGSGVLKGSARAPKGASVVDLMSALNEGTFTGFGGHEGAGGFSITKDHIHTLEQELNDAYTKLYESSNQSEGVEEIIIDASLGLSDVTYTTYGTLRSLAPFGVENQKPLFTIPEVTITSMRMFGSGKNHLEILVGQSTTTIKAIAFFEDGSSFTTKPEEGIVCTVIAEVEYSVFMGHKEVRLRIVDCLGKDLRD